MGAKSSNLGAKTVKKCIEVANIHLIMKLKDYAYIVKIQL